MTLGPSFRIEKAQRKVRTIAGVRFFDAPIGTPITSAMLSAAREKHGNDKTDKMLVSQRRNKTRDMRRSHYKAAATKRHSAREARVAANAKKKGLAQGRAVMAGDGVKELVHLTKPPSSGFPIRVQSKPVKREDGVERAIAALDRKDQKAKERSAARVASEAPIEAVPHKGVSNTDLEAAIDLTMYEGEWSPIQHKKALVLILKMKGNIDPEIQDIARALRERLMEEEG